MRADKQVDKQADKQADGQDEKQADKKDDEQADTRANQSRVESWRSRLTELDPVGVLAWATGRFGARTVFTSSLGLEDQVITHMVGQLESPGRRLQIAVIDTGRLFAETYTALDSTRNQYPDHRLRVYFPQSQGVETMVNEAGPNLFFDGVEQRKRCCFVRKVEPLRRALSGKSCWVTGLRRQQSSARGSTDVVEWDEAHGVVKVNPLWNWSERRLAAYQSKHRVPYNPLHDRGYPSVGCAPCTRAVAAGEDPRSGRWWWESGEERECGLHAKCERDADRIDEPHDSTRSRHASIHVKAR
ncbi:MAG: phosphoadenylyl-sulfate reductase [Nannocystaceae bacterium]